MKRYQDDFPGKLRKVDFETLEQSESSICGISDELRFIYFNPAWERFAKENGVNDIIDRFPLNTSLTAAIGGKKVEAFYLEHYKQVLTTGKAWHHDYECSSYNEFRRFHQMVYPVDEGQMLIVANTLQVSLPMESVDRKAYRAAEKRYVQSTGFITQCSNCRCVQRAEQPEVWDWVPEWVEHMPDHVSHSICPVCFDYYYKYHTS